MQNIEFVKGRRYRFEPIKGVLVHSDLYRSGIIEVIKIVGNTVFCNILEGVITEEKFDVFDKDSNIAKCLFDDLYDCIEEDNSLISFLYSFT